MVQEKRKSKRQEINRHAKIQFASGSLPRDCLVSDISDGGVRLHVEGMDVPDRFALVLADGDGQGRPRDCRVVWRLGCEVGAKFLDTFGRDNGSAGAARKSGRHLAR